MNRACLACISVLPLGLLACIQGNPDFNKSSVGDEVGDTATDESGTATGTEAGTGDSSSGNEAGTADAGTTTMGTAETTADESTETNVEPCLLTLHEPLRIAFGDPSFNNGMCFVEYEGRVHPFEIKDGQGWLLNPTNEFCNPLQESEHPLTVTGIPGSLPALYPPQPYNIDVPLAGCFFISVSGFLGMEGNDCLYSSVQIWNGNGPETKPVFAAVRDDAPIYYTDPQSQTTVDWKPDTDTIRENCSCDTVEDGVECCADLGAVTTYDFIVGDNEPMTPPVDLTLPFLASEYTFFGKQAQSAQLCGHPKQVSWALWRLL